MEHTGTLPSKFFTRSTTSREVHKKRKDEAKEEDQRDGYIAVGGSSALCPSRGSQGYTDLRDYCVQSRYDDIPHHRA